MLVRFVVYQRLSRFKHNIGLFQVAQHLLDEGDISIEEREELEAIVEWFRLNLPLPPYEAKRDPRVLYWYRSGAGEYIRKMWGLAHLLEAHDYAVELITARFVGKVIYEDEWQVAAVPHITF